MIENIQANSSSDVEGYIPKIIVAQRMKKSVRCIEGWMKAGLLPYYKVRGATLFRWSEIEEHLRQTCRVCRSSPHNNSAPASQSKIKNVTKVQPTEANQ